MVAVEWDGGKNLGDQEVLSSVSEQFTNSRFNDGKADIKGRVWLGKLQIVAIIQQ